jgi:ferredoxin-NADP reductase
MTPTRFSVPLRARRWLSENSIELHLARPAEFDFKAGQCIRLFHADLERDYSLAAAPQDPELTLVVRVFPRGRVSTWLSTVEIGQPIDFYGPMGYFVFQATERTPVFVATGTGVAPFVAMCRAGVRNYICLQGAKNASGLLYTAELKESAALYVPCLSAESDPGDKTFAGRVTGYLAAMETSRAYDFYLCGHQAMIRDAFGIIDDRFDDARIHSEVFY